MDSVNLGTLAERMAQATGRTPADARRAITDTLDALGAALAEGKAVKLNNFGTLAAHVTENDRYSGFTRRVEHVRNLRGRLSLRGRLREAILAGEPYTGSRRSPKSY